LNEFDRKVVIIECQNTSWYLTSKNEILKNESQLINECFINRQQQQQESKNSYIDYYFKKNFKNLLNLKLNLRLFLIILLISSSLIIIFLMFLLAITFYKRYRMTNYYQCFITRPNRQQTRSGRFFNRFINRRFSNPQQQQQPQTTLIREDQLQFSIGSSSSLNNQTQQQQQQHINLPTYDEAINKPAHPHEAQAQQQPPEATTPPSPPPSFSAISKEASNLQSRDDNIDSQSNYSSISAAPALMASNHGNKQAKQLRFNPSNCSQISKNSRQYLHNQPQQNFYDSNETFSLNSAYCITNNGGTASIAASAIGASSYVPSEICTIITNSSLNSAESNASKLVLRGSIENNIDQTSLFNYSTSLSDAVLHTEGKFW
jgi:hypothetical protein